MLLHIRKIFLFKKTQFPKRLDRGKIISNYYLRVAHGKSRRYRYFETKQEEGCVDERCIKKRKRFIKKNK